jgi:hypothetical protein
MFSPFPLKSIPCRHAFSLRIKNLLPAIIVIVSMSVAAYWVFLVPIFQEPNEERHADYVLSLYSKGRLIRAEEAPLAFCSHPFVAYLIKATDCQGVEFSNYIKMPANYGTREFFQNIDKEAPDDRICKQVSTNPFVVAICPVGYYALTALWLGLLSHINGHLSFLIFAGRFFSVILLGCGLVISYSVMRQLRLSEGRALIVIAAIGFFPMVTMVGSYIHPDNLTFVAVSACWYFALRWRNRVLNCVESSLANSDLAFGFRDSSVEVALTKNWDLWSLAAALAVLSLTKYPLFGALE